MDHFHYKGDEAFCEDLSLTEIAKSVDTPAYVYSSATLSHHCKQFQDAFASQDTTFCYAVKANSNLSVLKQIFSAGFGADIVSQGELERALLAGVDAKKVVYSGVAKKESEIERALQVGILSFNVESFFELELIAKTAARLGKKAPVCLRLNPDIDAKTHPKISTGLHSTKFGIPCDQLDKFLNLIQGNRQNLELIGLACHIGSQLTDLRPIADAAKQMMGLVNKVRSKGFPLKYLNMGGGLGIRYTGENAPLIADYAKTILKSLDSARDDGSLSLILEPGRVLVGNAGILLTRVQSIKVSSGKKFAIVDAGMNDLIRPTLYDSEHSFRNVVKRKEAVQTYDIVGPVCETGDYLGLNKEVPEIKAGDLIYVRTCGAYGSCMSSNYNSRPRPVEVMVEGTKLRIVRKREKFEDLWRGEL